MIQPGLVSTIVPVHNRGALLREAIASVLAQTYRPIEIIIVDDGSTDDTGVIVRELAAAHPEVIRHARQKNAGPGSARERGRAIARGEFIQYLDSDDLLLPRKFEVQVAALRARPDCGIAYGMTRLVDADRRVLEAPFKGTGYSHDTLYPALLTDRWWNTHTPLFRRSVCDAIGSWADMRMSEDWEYDARAGALGVRLVHCPESLSETRVHATARLTGGALDGEKARDIRRALEAVYHGAIAAGVTPAAPEMQHFARRSFLLARQLGARGLARDAEAFFRLARAAAGRTGDVRIQLGAYRALAAVLGWTTAGRISEWRDSHSRAR